MKKYNRLVDEYRYPGFRPLSRVLHHPDNPDGRIITLQRRQKKLSAARAGQNIILFMIGNSDWYATFLVVMLRFILKLRYGVLNAGFAEK